MLKIIFTVFLFVLVASVLVSAQDSPPIKWKLTVPDSVKTLKTGDSFGAILTAEIAENWHLYALEAVERGPVPTKIFLADAQPFELGKIDAPEPIETDDNSFGVVTKFYEESADFKLPLKVSEKATAGKQMLQLKVRFQACSNEMCLPPKTLTLETPVEIAGDLPKANEKGAPQNLKFTDEDKSLIIKSVLEQKLPIKKQTPQESAENNLVINLSEKNIDANLLPKFPQVEFVLLNADDIKNYKGRELTYREFEKIEFNGYNVKVTFSINNLAKGVFPGKSSSTYEYYKINGKWVGRMISAYDAN